jgi:AraC family transcriptional regulator, transcriptional activator of pobA
MKVKTKTPIRTYGIDHGFIQVHEIIRGQYARFDQAKYLVPHRRDFFSFFLVTSGYLQHSIDFQQYTHRAGELFFTAPYQVHLIEGAGLIAGMGVACRPELLTPSEEALPIIQNPKQVNKISLSRRQAREILQVFQAMLAEYESQEVFSADILRSLLATLLLMLSRHYQHQEKLRIDPNAVETAVLEKFRQLLNARWNEPLSVAACEKALFLGSGRLNQLAKKRTGKNASELIQEKRLLEAKRLLLYSDQSIKEISYQTGFEDPAYFNRFFKKWNQVTPLKFRQDMQKKYNRVS